MHQASSGPNIDVPPSKPSASRPDRRSFPVNPPSGHDAGSRSRCISSLAKESELHPVGIHSPSGLARHRLLDLCKIGRGLPVVALVNIGQNNPEILTQPLLQRQIGGDVVLAGTDIIGRVRSLRTSSTGNSTKGASRQISELLLSRHFQETKRQIEDVESLLLLGSAGIAGKPQQPARLRLWPKRRLEKLIGIPFRSR